MDYVAITTDNHIEHHGILGQKWGVRRYQNADGSLTEAGKRRQKYDMDIDEYSKTLRKEIKSIQLDKTARDPEAYRRWEIEKKLYKEQKDINKEANFNFGSSASCSPFNESLISFSIVKPFFLIAFYSTSLCIISLADIATQDWQFIYLKKYN